MSYQYPPPPQEDNVMEPGPSGYMPNYSGQHQPSSGAELRLSPNSGHSTIERRDSYSDSTVLRKSISTSAMRSPQTLEQQSQLPISRDSFEQNALNVAAAEKRRNKLGYHRTSVACGHCRRRKIRCIPSPADSQGRCVNCIRLKKECTFFPVDQPPPQDTRQKSMSRSSVGPKIASASSSPVMAAGLPSDAHGQQHPHLTIPSIKNMAPRMEPLGRDKFSPDERMLSSACETRTFEYGYSGMTQWMSRDADPSSPKPSDMDWRYPAESPIIPATPAFAPYPGGQGSPPSGTWSASVSGEPSVREDMAWPSYPEPPRSLSIGSHSMANQHQEYPPISPMGHHSSRPYASPIATAIPGIETMPGMALDHHVPLSAGTAVPSAHYSTWPQYSYVKPGESYAAWYDGGAQQQPLGQGDPVNHSSVHHPPGDDLYYIE